VNINNKLQQDDG